MNVLHVDSIAYVDRFLLVVVRKNEQEEEGDNQEKGKKGTKEIYSGLGTC